MTSRRTILKSIGLVGLGSLTLTNAGKWIAGESGVAVAHAAEPDPPFTYHRWNGEPLARIAGTNQPARVEPNIDADIVERLPQNTVVRVRGLVRGEKVYPNNDLWIETRYGYLYASLVQPVNYHLPAVPVADLGEGRWAEVIVPYSESFKVPDPYNKDASKDYAYYGCIFYVTDLVTGTDGRSWYKIQEMYQTIYLPATHLRLIPESELTRLSPDVPDADKHIVVRLRAQTVTAYEYDQPVFSSPCSSGIFIEDTPVGEHRIFDKRIGDRMVPTSLTAQEEGWYNLPGVPYCSYFTLKYVALHGCFWHNDFGRQRSHGCVNLPNEAAKWVYRWSTPPINTSELYTKQSYYNEGTKIIVVNE
jgi:lipoprotein-anchoring transpeptidase ErfK/SrfK